MNNIEIKTSLDSIPKMEQRLKKLDARYQGLLNQVDTYFSCPNGRIKLREVNDKQFEIIFYRRSNSATSKTSYYQIVTLTRTKAREFKKFFTDAYGVMMIIKKQRRLWLYKNTRIHLDRVVGLGTFLELETVIKNITMVIGKKEHAEVISLLDLKRFKTYSQSYSDMLARKKKNAAR